MNPYHDAVLARLDAAAREGDADTEATATRERDGGLSLGQRQPSNPGQAAREYRRTRYTIGL